LYFLRKKAGKEAYLIFLYFIADLTHISTSPEAWNSALKLEKKLMGLSAKHLSGKVIDLFINVNEITSFKLTTDNWPLTTIHVRSPISPKL